MNTRIPLNSIVVEVAGFHDRRIPTWETNYGLEQRPLQHVRGRSPRLVVFP
jgi:hypothetical protein